MKTVFIRTGLFAATVACAYAVLWTPFRSSYSPPMRFEDFILCIAIQTSVPLIVWIALPKRRFGRVMQTVVALFWTWLASSLLVHLADRFHDSSVYQPPRPWDHLFYEGGILGYLALMIPLFSVIAAALTIIPFAGESFP